MRKAITTTVLFLCCASSATADIVFDWATVGNAGNAADTTGFGMVDSEYRISKHEVTNAQYADFLNRVATTDTNALFNASMDIVQSGSSPGHSYTVNAGFESKPVRYVSFLDAMRFVNWLENGQPTGLQDASTTEAGVYSVVSGNTESRSPSSTFYIPSENEWYKAAYHDPGAAGTYWAHPTRSNTAPTAEAPPGGSNSANLPAAGVGTTDIGAYVSAASFYGTFDQAGNVREWNENLVSGRRGVRGGDGGSTFQTASTFRSILLPDTEHPFIGFRVASAPTAVPEPSAFAFLGLIGSVGVGFNRSRRRSSCIAKVSHV